MKRKFYFIKDSVTGNFYEGKSADDISTFDKAAVYFQHKNAEKKIKEYIDDAKYIQWPMPLDEILKETEIPKDDEETRKRKFEDGIRYFQG